VHNREGGLAPATGTTTPWPRARLAGPRHCGAEDALPGLVAARADVKARTPSPWDEPTRSITAIAFSIPRPHRPSRRRSRRS
jgi:hypothetical protein